MVEGGSEEVPDDAGAHDQHGGVGVKGGDGAQPVEGAQHATQRLDENSYVMQLQRISL